MDYKSSVMYAAELTKKLGLECPKNIQFQSMMSIEEKERIHLHTIKFLYENGFDSAKQLAAKCVPVHLQLQAYLEEVLGEQTLITIGDRYWYDKIYCEMSEESIRKELDSPSNAPLNAHVWLSLRDGSILDCTSEAHIDLMGNRGEFPIENCVHFTDPYNVVNDDMGCHRPFLVGPDFLIKTNSFAVYKA